MIEKLEKIRERYDELNELLSDPDIFNEMDKYLPLSKEQKQMEGIVRLSEKYIKVLRDIEGAKNIVDDDSDKELLEIAVEEIKELDTERETLEEEIKVLLVPRDPEDEKNVIMEIRAGTGGDEACLFAGDLYKMYVRFSELSGWKIEVLSSHTQEIGGFKEIIFLVKGDGVYGKLKFEAGVHRVQRVPATETSGRIHTSAASVAVLPEAEDVDVGIEQKDLKIDVYRSSGPGGQSVNTTDSAVRITHIPTGMVVTCQDEKSQHKNRAKALKVLQARLYERKLAEEQEKAAATRRTMVSTGDRSAKIRTFNFPQGRVTDHRIGLTLYKLDEVLNGSLDNFIEQLQLADRTEKLEKS